MTPRPRNAQLPTLIRKSCFVFVVHRRTLRVSLIDAAAMYRYTPATADISFSVLHAVNKRINNSYSKLQFGVALQ